MLLGVSFLCVSLLPAVRGEVRDRIGTDGSWDDKTKWDGIGSPPMQSVPLPGDDAEFSGANETYAVTVNGNAIHDIRVEAANLTLNLAGNLTASGKLYGYLFGYPQTFGARSVSITGSGTLSADSIMAETFTIGSGATVKTTNEFAAAFLNATGATLNTGAFSGQVLQISGGSTMTSSSADVSSASGNSTLDASTWNVSGQLTNTNAFTLTVKNGATLTSGSALTTHSGGVTVDGAGSSWKITNDAQINSSSGPAGGLDVERSGVVTIGGDLSVGNSGAVFANYQDTSGASRIDVSGKVTAGGGGIFLGQGATLTSKGFITLATPFPMQTVPIGAFVSVDGTLTNTGVFIIGQSGQNTESGTNSFLVGGKMTTTGDLIVGQGSAFNTFSASGTVQDVNGVLGQNAGSQTTADVGGTWTNSGTLVVADAGAAILRIGSSAPTGGTVTNTAATVGNQANSNGLVDIQGSGKWMVNGNLVIGAAGASVGDVAASFGGQLAVTGSTITLGRDAGSTGTLTLDNAFKHGTQFNFTGDLQVGLAGKGTLEVLSGFQLNQGAKSLVLGGQATASGTLRVSDDNAQFGFPAATQTLYKSTNLTIGSLGTGTVKIEHKGLVQTTGEAVLGEKAGSTGMATITGPSSLWQVDGDLIIGKSGSANNTASGTVVVADSGQLKVNGTQFVLGQETGSRGTLVVDGMNSTVMGTGARELEIGRHGIGTLQLQNGADFSIPSTTLGALSDGAGRITVDGARTFLTVRGALTVGGASPGVAASLSDPGAKGGELVISGGAGVSTSDGGMIVGRDADSTGLVTLSGSDSFLSAGEDEFVVGKNGTGAFNVSNGGRLSTATLVLGQKSQGDGSLRVTGSGGTKDAFVDVDRLDVGVEGKGRLILENGAKLFSTSRVSPRVMSIGIDTDGDGQITVEGAGTSLQTDEVRLGELGGDGQVKTVNGGKTQVSGAFFVDHGSIIVDGASSTLTAKKLELNEASAGSSALSITSGGSVVVTGDALGALNIRNDGGNVPMVSVNGQGAQLTVANGSTLLSSTLAITGGGSATLQDLQIASSGNEAKLSVGGDAGTSSTLTVTGELNIGLIGSKGALDVGAGGQVNAQLVTNVFSSEINVHDAGATFTSAAAKSGLFLSLGQLNVSGGGTVSLAGTLYVLQGMVSLSGGSARLNANSLNLGASSTFATTAGDRVNIGSSVSVSGGSSISNGGSFNVGGTLGEAPDGTAFIGLGGKLKVNGEFFGPVVVQPGGTVGGAGTINGKLINSGKVGPGDPQTLTVNGDYEQLSGGVLQLQIAGTKAGEFDVLDVNGKLTLGGRLELDFIDGFLPKTGDVFDFLNSDTLAGQFADIEVKGLAPGWQYSLVPGASGVELMSASAGSAANAPIIRVEEPAGTRLTSGDSTVDFGSVMVSGREALVITVKNLGPAPLENLAVKITSSDATDFKATAIRPTTVSAHGMTKFTVKFAPLAAGIRNATLQIDSNDLFTPSFSIALTGTGVSFTQEAGTYTGLSSDGSSLLTLALTSTGKFTGKLFLEGTSYALKGALDLTGNFTGRVGKPAIAVTLHLQPSGGGANLGDSLISGSAGTQTLAAHHATYGKGQTASEAGNYKVLLDPSDSSPAVPQGIGYATEKVGKTGHVTVKGKLADHTAFSSGGVLVGETAGHQFILFTPKLYFGKGLLTGPVTFERLTDSDCDGSLHWLKPKQNKGAFYKDGFDTGLLLSGSLYAKPLKGERVLPFMSGTVTLNGGSVGPDLVEQVTLSASNIVTVNSTNPHHLKLTLNAASGGFSGSFIHPANNKSTSFAGVIYQNPHAPQASGFFLGPVLNGSGFSGGIIFTSP